MQCPRFLRIGFLVILLLGAPAAVWPGLAHPAAAPVVVSATDMQVLAVTGTVSTLDGRIPLASVLVVLSGADGQVAAQTMTDESGRYRLTVSQPGKYRLRTNTEGFKPTDELLDLVAGPPRTADISLTLVELEQTVTVKPTTDSATNPTGSLAPAAWIDGQTLSSSALTAGSVSAELKWMPGVSPYGREWAIKGGRPNQIGLQVESAQVLDPAGGTSPVQLPGDAVNAVQVLANPYSVEYGRFSSGLIVITTKSGANTWSTAVNNFVPAFVVARGDNPFRLRGVRVFDPRLGLRGPIVRNKLFIAESAQMRYRSDEVASRPQDERQITRSLVSFTRLDWVASARHTLSATLTAAPENTDWVNLSTFTPPETTANLTQRVLRVGLSDRAQLPHSVVLEALAHYTSYRTGVDGHGSGTELWLGTEQNSGIHWADQQRRSEAWQGSITLSGMVGTKHLLKGGVDMMYASLDGEFLSRPINVLRADGTLAQRLVSGPSTLRAKATDVAGFLQDRWQPYDRLVVDYGVRIERNGLFGRSAFIPRVGAALTLDRARKSTIRGGWGYFYERVPLLVGAFEQLSDTTETTYGGDGTTPVAAPVVYTHVLRGVLETPRSRSWNIGYEHWLAGWVSLRANYLQRRGRHELVMDTLHDGAAGLIDLDSEGRSAYRDLEFGTRFRIGKTLDLDLTYTRSMSRADLNDAYGYYLNLTANPILRPNAYGPTDTDTPHRFVGRGRAQLGRWAFEGAGDIRSGAPWSAVDEQLDFVGARNSLRFPRRAALDVLIERMIPIGRSRPWVGLGFSNALNSFIPSDVQRNAASPSFGQYFNSPVRQVRITVHFRQ
jgi:outer membrane receptor for ferrienterochelin and colicin